MISSKIAPSPVVILAGGLGTRLREETEFKPKPMVEIGGYPILWHIMKIYSFYGLKNFIICAGYKKASIVDYFLSFHYRNNDIEISLKADDTVRVLNRNLETNWNIKIIDTGETTNTGGRLKKVEKHIDSETFLCTYGDGLADVNINELVNFHEMIPSIATLTSVKPATRFGVLEIEENGFVKRFSEKPQSVTWVNGGFFVFQREIFNYLNADSVLEHEPLNELAAIGELKAYNHTGFWQPMDTYREFKLLNSMWDSNIAPWKKWT